MPEDRPDTSQNSSMLKTIIAAFVTIIVFIGLALLWFKESPAPLLKTTSPSSTTAPLPSLSYNDSPQQQFDNSQSQPNLSPTPAVTKSPGETLPIIKTNPEQHISSAVARLNTFFENIDETEYFQKTFPTEKSEQHFSALLQKLVDNPPVISGEADDLFTLLQNTAHFFRILGGQNIALTKKIVSENKANVEQLAADFFIVLNSDDILLQHYQVSTASTALYNYGCFFLNTMGGRLYMFRRDLEMRMLLSYYSLLFVYYAEINGENFNGLDVRPFLKTLIYEMENYGQKLSQRDIYLARLYNLESSLN